MTIATALAWAAEAKSTPAGRYQRLRMVPSLAVFFDEVLRAHAEQLGGDCELGVVLVDHGTGHRSRVREELVEQTLALGLADQSVSGFTGLVIVVGAEREPGRRPSI